MYVICKWHKYLLYWRGFVVASAVNCTWNYDHTHLWCLKLHALKFTDLVIYHIAQIKYKARNKLLPANIQIFDREGVHNLRERINFKILTTVKIKCMSIRVVELWNSLSMGLKVSGKIQFFKNYKEIILNKVQRRRGCGHVCYVGLIVYIILFCVQNGYFYKSNCFLFSLHLFFIFFGGGGSELNIFCTNYFTKWQKNGIKLYFILLVKSFHSRLCAMFRYNKCGLQTFAKTTVLPN